jgi:creatinine amidohydrolase
MKWENLTTPQFEKAIETCEGVCLLPLGVLEKHGDHLPLGTDVFIAQELACRAAEIEPAIVFPPYFFTQIFEARHTPGTVGIDSRVMYDLLEATCDEIARNGLNKIILVNAHGGNRFFLPHFMMLQLERPRDYVVYIPKPGMGLRSEAMTKAWAEMRQSKIRDEHAGESETSMMLAIHPDLVDSATLPNEQGRSQERLKHLDEAGLYTAISWYADFPHHYSGQAEYGTVEKGQFLLNAMAQRLAQLIRVVKDDDQALALQDEFFSYLL